MGVQQSSCPSRPGLICYNITDVCLPGPLLGPVVDSWQHSASLGDLGGDFAGPSSRSSPSSPGWPAAAVGDNGKDRGQLLEPVLEQLVDNATTNKSLSRLNSSLAELNGSCPSNPAFELLKQAVTCPGAYGLLCLPASGEARGSRDWTGIFSVLGAVLLVHCAAVLVFLQYRDVQRSQLKSSMECEAVEQFEAQLIKCTASIVSSSSHCFRGIRAVKRSRQISLSFAGLSLKLPDGRCLLKEVTGDFAAGRISALMGPSGCGKSTLMTVLARAGAGMGNLSGEIMINGEIACGKHHHHHLGRITGFVPQDDIVHEQLSVREQISYSARLRNSPEVLPSRLDRITEDVLAVMQIRHIQHQVVGGVFRKGVSGGQRKRVNIGLELASCPQLLFLDEPTSGLDATSALGILHSMKALAGLGMTIVMVIHQPRYSLFTLFDDALLLGPGGRTVYMGSAGGAKPYFESLGFRMPENENPADWFMDVICGEARNTLMPSMKPQHLFGRWKTMSKSGARSGVATASADLPTSEKEQYLRRAMEEEWQKLDVDGDGVLDVESVRSVLADCSGEWPSEQVWAELSHRMGGHCGTVEKQDFLDFLVNLHSKAESHHSPNRRGDWSSECTSSDFSGLSDDEEDDESAPMSSAGGSSWNSLQQDTSLNDCAQFIILLKRSSLQAFRRWRMRLLGYLLVCFGAVMIGVLTRGQITLYSSAMALNIFIPLTVCSLLQAISSLNTFGLDRGVFWRERSSGVSSRSYFLARVAVNLFDVLTQSVIFTTSWYSVVGAVGSVLGIYVPVFALVSLVASSWGYLISSCVSPDVSTLAVALAIMIFGCALGMPNQVVALAGHSGSSSPFDHHDLTARPWVWEQPCEASFLVWSTAMAYVAAVEAAGGPDLIPVGPGRRLYQAYAELAPIGDLGLSHFWTCALVQLAMCFLVGFAGYLGLVLRSRHRPP